MQEVAYSKYLANKSGKFRVNYNNKIAFATPIDEDNNFFNLVMAGEITAKEITRDELQFCKHFQNHKLV